MTSLSERRKLLQNKLNEKNIDKKQVILLGGRYKLLETIGNGVSSTVIAALDTKTNKKVAIKKIKRFLENKHESLRILRQLILLRQLDHPNIIKMSQIIIEDEQCRQLSLVLQYFPTDIKHIFKSNRALTLGNIKQIVFQLLAGLNYCNQCQVLHRDLKPQNILVNQDFSQVKLCDFGLARAVNQEDSERNHLISQNEKQEENNQSNKVNLSAHVATRWYRAPELILLEKNYNSAIDMWSIGCILGQLLSMLEENAKTFMDRKPLFPGKACYPLSPPKSSDMKYKKVNQFPHSVNDQLNVIFSIIGTPTDISFISEERARNYIESFGKVEKKPFKKIFEFIPVEVQDFLEKSLLFNPSKRMTVSQAIKHPMFNDIRKQLLDNVQIKGSPLNMQLQKLSIEDIKQLVMKQLQYYKTLKMEQQ